MADPSVRTELQKIWEEALDAYAQTTERPKQKSRNIFKMFHTSSELLSDLDSPNTPKNLQDLIQDRKDSFKQWRNPKEHPKLWSNLQTCIGPLSRMGDVIRSALGLTPFAPASTIFGAVVFLINSAQGVSDAYDYIAQLLTQLSEFTTRMEYYLLCEVGVPLQRKLVEIMATLLEIFARAENAIRKGRFKEYLSVTFKGKDDMIESAKKKLEGLFADEAGLVLAKTYAAGQQTKAIVVRTEDKILAVSATADRTEGNTNTIISELSGARAMTQESQDLQLLKESLDASSLDKVRRAQREYLDQLDMVDRKGKAAAKWFQDLDLFKDWIGKKAPILWILGPSGTGKSCLSSKIIEYLRARFPQDPEHPIRISIAYFYINADDPNLSCMDIVLKIIAYQIARNDPVYRNYAVNLCRNPDSLISTRDIWTRLFIDFFSNDKYLESSAFVVVDGLDRAPKIEQAIFLELLASLEQTQARCPRLQFALLGDENIRGDNWSLNRRLPIEIAKANTADIIKHVNASVKRIKILRRGRLPDRERAEFQNEICQKLTAGANGRFTWVDLVVKKVLDKGYKEVVRAAVDNASHDFLELIWQAFKNLAMTSDEEEDFNELGDFKLILGWVTFAARPLSLGEIATIVRMDKPNHEENTLLEEDLRGKFAAFFTLHREDKLTTRVLTANAWEEYRKKVREPTLDRPKHDSEDDYGDSDEDLGPNLNFQSSHATTVLSFSDETFKEYMALETNPATRKFPAIPAITLEKNQAHYKIAMSCLTALCDPNHQVTYGDTNMVPYAADYFGEHLFELDMDLLPEEDRHDLTECLVTLFTETTVLETWIFGLTDFYKTLKRWMRDNTLAKKLCKYLASQGVSKKVEMSEGNLQPLSKNGETLFRELEKYSFFQWLTPPKKTTPVLFWVLWLDLRSSFTEDGFPPPATDTPYTQDLKGFTGERLQQLANASELEKNASWYRRLATTLRQAGHIDAAMEEYGTTLKMDPLEYYPYIGVALCYESKKDFENAIDWMLQALEHLPGDEEKESRSEYYTKLSTWSIELGKFEEAVDFAAQGRLCNANHIDAVYGHVKALGSLQGPDRVEKTFELLEKLQAQPTEIAGISMLTRLLTLEYSIRVLICPIASTPKQREFLISAFNHSEKELETQGEHYKAVAQRYMLAYFLHLELRRFEDAAAIYEEILDEDIDNSIQTADNEDAWNEMKSSCSMDLSDVYFNLATAAKAAGTDISPFIAKLEGLAKKSFVNNEIWGTGLASMALAMLYRQDGRVEEADSAIREKVLESLAILEDSIPENDMQGYIMLGQTMIMAGRFEDALAAFAVMFISLDRAKGRHAQRLKRAKTTRRWNNTKDVKLDDMAEEEGSSRRERDKVEAENAGRSPDTHAPTVDDDDNLEEDIVVNEMMRLWDKPGICDGPCRRLGIDFAELYDCINCMGTTLCELCISLQKTVGIPEVNCSPSHVYLKVYPVEEKYKGLATEVVNGILLPRKEWLDKLRAEWTLGPEEGLKIEN